MTRRLAALVAVAAGVASAGPEVSARVLERVGWSRGDTSYSVSQPEVFFELGQRPHEQLKLELRAAALVGQRLIPTDGAVDVGVRWTPSGWAPGEGVWAQLSPLGATRLRFGFDPVLQLDPWIPWQSQPFALAVGLAREQWRAQMVVKSVQVRTSFAADDEQWHSVLMEGAWSSPKHWNVAVAGAYLPGGRASDVASQGVTQETGRLAGAMRVTYRTAGEIGAPLDLVRLARTPWGDEALFAPAPPRPALGLEVVVEGILAEEHQVRPRPPASAPPPKPFGGGHVSVRGAVRDVRLQAGAAWRSLDMVVAQLGTPLFVAVESGPFAYDDVWVDASADLALPGTGFTPGVHLRFRRPGGFTELAPGSVTLTFDPPGFLADTLPPRVACSAVLTGTWTPVPQVGVLVSGGYEYDPNRAEIREVQPGLAVPVFVTPHQWSLGVTAQLGF